MAETCTHPKLDRPKPQTMNFVKSSMGQLEESKSDESQIADKPQIWQATNLNDLCTHLKSTKLDESSDDEAKTRIQSNDQHALDTPITNADIQNVVQADVPACTRRADEICADGFSSSNLAGTNSGEEAAAAAAGGARRTPPETRFLCQPALEELTRSVRTDSPRQIWPEQIPAKRRRRRRRAAHGV
ncbi:APO protein 4, mitochondrial-like [Dorcoceras hygrometricum]|uniref:APO protein 4, mitochondrial-like n=1 Tax=Dorcoceras hygrometricum TaxID=472368 RepID=A0A2Z7AY12_9LAMI|nr:APO protein 4, mitochondrial-like [Dorcoceras hygrometricum]